MAKKTNQEKLQDSNRKSKQIFKRPVQSSQQNIPIRDIINGVILTKDYRYIKVMEIKPISFDMKSYADQTNIFNQFQSVLKVCPSTLQLTAMCLPANLKKQLDVLEHERSLESNPELLKVYDAYRDRLLETERTRFTRRFFLSFQYEGRKTSDISQIIFELNRQEQIIAAQLANCGNEVVSFNADDRNAATLEILYTILNRNESVSVPFEVNSENTYMRYFESINNPNFYVPPNDFIAPKNVSYLNSRYVVVNASKDHPGTYYSFLYIPTNGYNPYVIPGWLQMFIFSYPGVDLNIHLERVPSEEVMNNIRRNLVYSGLKGSENSQLSSAYESAETSFSSGSYLRNGLRNGQEFYYCSTMITVSGFSPEDVDNKIQLLKSDAAKYDIKLKECKHVEESCFKASLPLCSINKKIWERSKRNMLTEGAASMYPFISFEMNDENGIYFGDDIDSRIPVIIDIFDTKKFQNPNIFICGQSGAGKTFALLLMAIRMRIKRMPCFILAPEKEHEFRRACAAMKGQFIQLGAGSPNKINIMEIFKKDEESVKRIDGHYENVSYLLEKVDMLMNFFKLHIYDMTNEEEAILNRALVETYRKKGITINNDTLYDPNDFLGEKFKTMPIIADLQDTLREFGHSKRLVNILDFFVTGSGSAFNGQTNVDLNNPFTVIGLEHLKGNLLPLGIFVAMDFVWSKIKEDRTKQKALFIDEWWKMASNPIAAEYSLQIAKTIRAYSGAMIISTQQMNDIMAVEYGKYGYAVLNNCKTKIILQLEKKDVESVQSYIGITDKEVNMISNFERGDSLFVFNGNNIKIHFQASPIEKDLISTDRKDLIKLAQKEEDCIELMSVDDMEVVELIGLQEDKP